MGRIIDGIPPDAPTRGGKRPGAGRPAIGRRVEARLDPEAEAGLARWRARTGGTDAEAVRAALRAEPPGVAHRG